MIVAGALPSNLATQLGRKEENVEKEQGPEDEEEEALHIYMNTYI